MTSAAPEPKENMGRPEPRIDGRLKVTGAAKYASDADVSKPLYAALLTSAIAKGSITSIDRAAAAEIPGVVAIYTNENMPPVGEFAFFGAGGEAGSKAPALAGSEIHFDGQIIGLVVANTYEVAREATFKVKISYSKVSPSPEMESTGVETADASDVSPRHIDVSKGDLDRALAMADVKVEATYETPAQVHNPIELFSTTCQWSGDMLTVYEPSQFVTGMKFGLARQLAIKPEQIHVVCPFVGGAFGSKGSLTHRTSLVARASKLLGRPVKLVATREQGFTIATHRAETRHKIRTRRDGWRQTLGLWPRGMGTDIATR